MFISGQLQLQKTEGAMGTNYTLSSILQIARADFLQRVRSYYFLITIGVCVFIIYSFVPALDAGYKMVSLGNYRGFYNSAWIGGMVAMCVPFFTLLGFYVINNAVKRDIDTGVGQIIATTRVTSLQYLSGKFLSNFAVLLTMVGVIALMTVVMFFLRGEAIFEPWKLMSPLLVLTVPAMFVLAAIAVVFDSFTSLGRGVINIAYFFFWVFLISSSLWARNLDVFGVNTCLLQITTALSSAHPDWSGDSGTGILITGSVIKCKVFIWEGMNWTAGIVLQRIFWMIAAFGLVVLASLKFNRFDTIQTNEKKRKPLNFLKKRSEIADDTALPLHIRYLELPPAQPRFSYFSLVKAELKLMLNGNSRLWMIATAGLFIACIFAPLEFGQKFGLPLLWFMQILILSKLGSREVNNRCNEYVFSAPSPLRRQLPATIMASVLLTFVLALPVLSRAMIAGDLYSVSAITVGSLFIPLFAISSGILSGGSKLFEVVFTMMVYGIINGIPFLDLTGGIPGSREAGIAYYFLAAALFMLIVAFAGRKKQMVFGA